MYAKHERTVLARDFDGGAVNAVRGVYPTLDSFRQVSIRVSEFILV